MPGRLVATLLLLWLVSLAGCNSAPAPAPEEPSQSETVQAVAEPAGEAPETADLAILSVIEGLREKRPEALWDFLPGSYQRDLNTLLQEFARRMDPELWSASMQTLGRLADILKTQLGRLPPENAAPDWEGLAALLDTVAHSDLADLKRLEHADAREFLATTGHRLLEQLEFFSVLSPDDPFAARLTDLAQTQVAVVSSDANTAVVRVDLPDQGPQPVNFVRIENKWIPQPLAEGWIEFMGQARARLSLQSPENLAEVKPQWLTLLKTAQKAIDHLAGVNDPAEFETSLESVKFALYPLLGMLLGGLPEPAHDGPIELATIVVPGKIDTAELNGLGSRLQALLPPASFFETTSSDEQTTFIVGPVGDLEAFAGSLSFLEIVKVDPRERKITVRIK